MSNPTVLAHLMPRRTKHRLLLASALLDSALRRGLAAMVVDFTEDAGWTVRDIDGSRVVHSDEGTAAATLTAWINGEDPPDLSRHLYADARIGSYLLAGSHMTGTVLPYLAQGAIARGLTSSLADYLEDALSDAWSAVGQRAGVMILLAPSGLGPLPLALATLADHAFVQIAPDTGAIKDVERSKHAVEQATLHGYHHTPSVRTVWFMNAESSTERVAASLVRRRAGIDLSLRRPAWRWDDDVPDDIADAINDAW